MFAWDILAWMDDAEILALCIATQAQLNNRQGVRLDCPYFVCWLGAPVHASPCGCLHHTHPANPPTVSDRQLRLPHRRYKTLNALQSTPHNRSPLSTLSPPFLHPSISTHNGCQVNNRRTPGGLCSAAAGSHSHCQEPVPGQAPILCQCWCCSHRQRRHLVHPAGSRQGEGWCGVVIVGVVW